MRSGLLVLCIALVAVLAQGWLARVQRDALSEDARVAIELGCQRRQGLDERRCRSMLERLYLAGALEPDRTLRSYCDSVKAAYWGHPHASPPPLCTQRYGGW
jgi:hypothetical protein